MPISAERRTLLEQTLPPAESTRERMRKYMAVLDLTPKQFAPHSGTGPRPFALSCETPTPKTL